MEYYQKKSDQLLMVCNTLLDRLDKTTDLIHCKDCAFFEEDVFGYMNGLPIIVTNHGCKAWGGPMGSKTEPDGWCFLGRKKEQE